MKRRYLVILEKEIVEKLRKIDGFNLSNTLRNLLQGEADREYNLLGSVQLKKAEIELEKINLEKEEVLKRYDDLRKKIDKARYKDKVDVLDKHMEKVKEDNKCESCAGILPKKPYVIENKEYCKACFMGGNR